MKQIKSFGFAASLALFVLILAGCAQRAAQGPQSKVEPQEQSSAPKLALKFAPSDSTSYRVIRQNDKSVDWQGPDESKPKQFTGGHTGSKIEMTFTQQIQSIDGKGNAAAKITIKELKYLTRVKDQVVLDFDSLRDKDPTSPLSKLIGQSYTIELSSSGHVSKVIDAAGARAAVQGDSQAHKTASNLLSDDTIREMHATSALPPAEKDQARPGQSWSSIESFSFDLMGAKSYEKIYTLKEIEKKQNHQIAAAVMKGVPSAAMAKELHKEQSSPVLSNMFDNTETYNGELKLDLTEGKINHWREELAIEWMIVDPSAKPDEQPAALKMAATRLHSVERVN